MKNIINQVLILLFLAIVCFLTAAVANSREIIVEGHGKSEDEAIESAKIDAVSQNRGEYIDVNKKIDSQGNYLEKYDQVTNGIVSDAKVVENFKDDKVLMKVNVEDNVILAQNNKYSTDEIRKKMIRDGSNLEVLKDLYSDLNNIYDVKIEKTVITNGYNGMLMYDFYVSIKTNDNWLEKKNNVFKVANNLSDLIRTRLCSVSTKNIVFLDNNNTDFTIANNEKFFDNYSKSYVSDIYIGSETEYLIKLSSRSFKPTNKFDLKLILKRKQKHDGLGCPILTFQ